MTREGRPIGIKKVEACIFLGGVITARDQEAEPRKERPGIWYFDTIFIRSLLSSGRRPVRRRCYGKARNRTRNRRLWIRWEAETHEYRVELSPNRRDSLKGHKRF